MAVAQPTGGVWRTIRGAKVFLKPGQTPTQALAESGRGQEDQAGGGYGGELKFDSSEDEIKALVQKAGFRDVREVIAAGVPDSTLFPRARVVLVADGRLLVNAKSEAGEMTRSFDLQEKVVYNESFLLNSQGKGEGTRVFSSQVENAAAAGFVRMETLATRGPKSNGYYTWPRLGYDGSVGGVPGASRLARRTGRVGDLMKTPEGRAWWKKNGNEIKLKFYLEPGSQSRRVLDAYVAAKRGTTPA